MAAPVWETPSGDLGTIPELNYFQFELKAYDSIDPLRPVSFELVAGQTPTGMHINPYGAIQGNPETVIKVAGVPANVSQASTSQFAVRAQASDVYQEFTGDGTTTKFTLDNPVNFSVYKVITLVNQEPRTASYKIVNQILTVTMNEPVAVGKTLVVSVYRSGSIVADRTFSITVIGENAPQILTTSDLGTFQDGKYFSTNIATLDLDLPGDTLTWYISAGALPPGLSLDQTTGIVSGYITPIRTLAIKHYNFTITVNDGKLTDARQFTMAVICSGLLDASSDQITADLDQATIDQVIKYNPILLNVLPANGEIGPYTHDNYFMYKFDGLDWDNDSIKYALDLGSSDGFDATPFDTTAFDPGGLSLPPGLSLDPDTGWLTGYIPFQSELSVTYKFYVKVYKDQVFYTEMDGSTISYYQARRLVQLTVLGQNLAKVTWATNIDLGSIANGSVSELFVTASADNSHTLYYELAQGQYNRLPAGLQLETNGVIRGRATFSTFLIDSGQTTFDANSFVVDETTFDQIYQFTVRAYDNEGTANSYRTFSLRLAQINKTPYENLYMVAAMARSDRDALQTLLGNNNIIPTADLYRPDDSYFGLSTNLRMLLANGINPVVAADYVSAMNIKHYGKRFLFGEIKTAKVYNPDATVRYEVVYVDILDDLRNSKGQNVSAAVNVKTSNIPETVDMNDVTVDEQYFTVDGIKYVYPNNFYNMRRHMIDTLGQTNKALPDWMAQKQPDGRILGFTTGCVLAYVKPGTADKIAFRIRESGFDFKQLNVQIERYVWDNNLSSNFDKATGKFLHDRETTFDVYSSKYLYTLSLDGSSLVYPEPVNFVTPVLGIDGSSLEYPYNDLINDPASLPNYNRTTFDQNSMHFFPYRDLYAKLDQNDAYLKYPRTNVLR